MNVFTLDSYFGVRCGVCHKKRRPVGPNRFLACVNCDLTPSGTEFYGRTPVVPQEWTDGHRRT